MRVQRIRRMSSCSLAKPQRRVILQMEYGWPPIAPTQQRARLDQEAHQIRLPMRAGLHENAPEVRASRLVRDPKFIRNGRELVARHQPHHERRLRRRQTVGLNEPLSGSGRAADPAATFIGLTVMVTVGEAAGGAIVGKPTAELCGLWSSDREATSTPAPQGTLASARASSDCALRPTTWKTIGVPAGAARNCSCRR